ncbi:MAG TPA: hypothetical protein VGB30_14100 [bacterium]|jgi:hypothetical protein
MKYVPIIILLLAISGCATGNPITIVSDEVNVDLKPSGEVWDSHMLWGKWQFYFPVSRDRVDVTPLRTGQIHLNATKLLENAMPCIFPEPEDLQV